MCVQTDVESSQHNHAGVQTIDNVSVDTQNRTAAAAAAAPAEELFPERAMSGSERSGQRDESSMRQSDGWLAEQIRAREALQVTLAEKERELAAAVQAEKNALAEVDKLRETLAAAHTAVTVLPCECHEHEARLGPTHGAGVHSQLKSQVGVKRAEAPDGTREVATRRTHSTKKALAVVSVTATLASILICTRPEAETFASELSCRIKEMSLQVSDAIRDMFRRQ